MPPRANPVFCLFGPYAPASRATCASLGQKVVSFIPNGSKNRVWRNCSYGTPLTTSTTRAATFVLCVP